MDKYDKEVHKILQEQHNQYVQRSKKLYKEFEQAVKKEKKK